MKTKSKLTLFFFFLFLITFSISVFGEPPFSTQEATGDETLELRNPTVNYIKQNLDGVKLHIHLFNRSNGLIINNNSADCYVHIYNIRGGHILEKEMGFEYNPDNTGGEFELSIGPGNFSEIGQHSFIVHCNTSSQGGFTSSSFVITEDGLDPDRIKDPYNLMIYGAYLILVLILISFAHVFKKDKGTPMIYGTIASIFSFLMTAILLSGFKVINGVTFIIDINYYIIALTVGIGLYTAIISLAFYNDQKEPGQEY